MIEPLRNSFIVAILPGSKSRVSRFLSKVLGCEMWLGKAVLSPCNRFPVLAIGTESILIRNIGGKAFIRLFENSLIKCQEHEKINNKKY